MQTIKPLDRTLSEAITLARMDLEAMVMKG